MGLQIEKQKDQKRKKIYFLVSIFSNIGILFFFKYFNFFHENLEQIFSFFHWNYGMESLSFILPIGLSFHTFQSLSYIIEVYRGNQKAERSLSVYALYVLYFPQLVAGPIERPQNMLHQFHEVHYFRESRVVSGLRLMLWGFFKKIVIADNIAILVTSVYSSSVGVSSSALVVASVLFAFQIYCDFSGYSDIARGASRCMGIELMKNFNSPYLATSISEFWKRWHISLSTWFRDYVYIPLGGNRVSKYKTARNVLITFGVSGLWHGANWTFVVWGALHGMYLVFASFFKSFHTKSSWYRYIQILCTFVLVDIGWVFFRANSLSEAFHIIKQFPSGILQIGTHFFQRDFLRQLFLDLHIQPLSLVFVILSIGILLFVESSYEKSKIAWFYHLSKMSRYMFYYGIILWIFFVGYFGEVPFIYFQF